MAPTEQLTQATLNRREVLKLAVPGMLFAILTHAYRVVDQYWSQGISTEAQAAIGSSFFVVIAFYSLFLLVSAGAGPLIARATGAGDVDRRRRVFGTSVFAAVVTALVVAVLGGLGAEEVAHILGLQGETADQLVIYLRTLCLTILPLALTPLVDQCFISMGDTRTPMILQALSLGLNLVATPLFIYTFEWGIAGAALASNFTRVLSTGAGFWILSRRVGFKSADLWTFSELGVILRVGAPMAISTVTYAGAYVALLYVAISPLGPVYNAALGIGFSALESVSWPAFHGVELALASLVGRSLGANRADLAWRAIRLTLPLFTGLGLFVSFGFYFAGEGLTALFTESEAVHAAATEYAVILAWTQLFVAWECMFEGVLSGAGDTRAVFWLSAPFNLARIPLCWWAAFPLGYGAAGIWWMINLTSVAKVVAKWISVRGGRWSRLEL